jgi:hypothetical protein
VPRFTTSAELAQEQVHFTVPGVGLSTEILNYNLERVKSTKAYRLKVFLESGVQIGVSSA